MVTKNKKQQKLNFREILFWEVFLKSYMKNLDSRANKST